MENIEVDVQSKPKSPQFYYYVFLLVNDHEIYMIVEMSIFLMP